MEQRISISKAINRGHLIVNLPVCISMFGIPALAFYFSAENLIPNWGIGVSFVIGFTLAWLTWSFMIMKWRIWAFNKVRNVHELKKKAIEQGLMWNDDSWFNKTEIRTNSDKLQWKVLEKKFDKKDVFKEDQSVSKKSIIYYSKIKNTYEFLIMLIALGGGIYLLLKSDSYIIGTLLVLSGTYFGFKEIKKVFNFSPQITIDNKGIKTATTEFKNWSEIKNEEIIIEGYGKNKEFYMIYDYSNGFEKIKIDDFNISPKKLENLIRTYRIRNNKNYS
ncbi:hypothetical protein SAMN05216503_2022 [Polaribacter sp. KT25b]|uniref:hypothetical protein n=1 Tax=Polaribacter sp. KT25b TaxID=1855336 RepID=UPI00087B9A55|nr:hypothetical protein [Polaribacter sp. KT25b]SDS11567.1 hypothetical protein SAMN05216503_2022 [Polaribacter sp. KT25b]